MTKLPRLTAYLTGVFLLTMHILLSETPGGYLNAVSFITSIIIPGLIMLTLYGGKSLLIDVNNKDLAIEILQNWSRLILIASLFFFVTGCAEILFNLTDPGAIGRGAAKGLISLVIALVAQLFIIDPLSIYFKSGQLND
jgi:uncharacterized membrane protein